MLHDSAEMREIMEIILLAAGAVIFILSFFIPERKTEVSGQSRELAKEEVAALVGREMENVRGHLDDVVDEAISYAMEKTERSLERLSNEKIMAVNEYSDTVLAEIHKNHEEAMFLYDMLNSKHANLKDTVSVVNKTVKKAEEAVTGLQRLTPEVVTAGNETVPGNGTVAGNASVAGKTAAARNVAAAGNTTVARNAAGNATVARNVAAAGNATVVRNAAAAGSEAVVRNVAAAGNVAAAATAPVVMTGLQRLAPGNGNRPAEPAARAAAVSGETSREAVRAVPLAGSVPGTEGGQERDPGLVSFLPETDPDGLNNNRRILELYRQGKSKVAIARELGLGVGEVKLVIDLFQNQ